MAGWAVWEAPQGHYRIDLVELSVSPPSRFIADRLSFEAADPYCAYAKCSTRRPIALAFDNHRSRCDPEVTPLDQLWEF